MPSDFKDSLARSFVCCGEWNVPARLNIRLAKRLGWGMIAAGYAMHEVSFLQDLAVVMIAAGIVTVLFQRLKQPVVLGYIVAGILIGPHFSTLILGGTA